ncbi:MAG TPA: DUF5695 domain-containing protein [Candidatus Eisenbacteria bacterium]|nr:DUF5695 domain-containing protein [Candidatus Eisenbacteria bacterium]
MIRNRLLQCIFLAILVFILLALFVSASAQNPKEKKPPVPGPMLEQGIVNYETPEFTLSLVRSSQTVAALKPKGSDGFDFTPGDLLVARSQNRYFHLGDLTLRLRTQNSGEWSNYSTATARSPVRPLPPSGNLLASSDLAPTLPSNIPLEITRTWSVENGKLTLRFVLKNKSDEPVQIGALGIPMIFNNVLNDRSLEQAHAICSFYDPYIGEDAGYLQVTRLNGHGPALLVIPEGKTPFEAYNPILDHKGPWGAKPIFTDPTPRGITFEGFYEWMVHSQAYAENEWRNAQPWNPPTELALKPGESKTYGLQFVLSDSIRHIESTLSENHRPVAVGVPGFVLPQDIEGRLFLKYDQPVTSVKVQPTSAIDIHEDSPTRDGQRACTLRGKSWGRVRLTVTYADGLKQTIQYFVIKPSTQVVSDMGRFLTTRQWFSDSNDPFHRAPSSITYDRELNQMVLQDSRVWIAGLSDEGGAGSWLAAVMKEFVQPDKDELVNIQEFVDNVLWGRLQSKDGPHAYGVRKSLFYYQPDQMPANYYNSKFDWKSWTSWNKQASEAVDRSYDYPHVAAAYWVLYRLARNHPNLVTNHSWDWYLNQAYETSVAMTKYAQDLSVFGQMEGTIFVAILQDLKRENIKEQADALESNMRARADRWKSEAYPFGSEMPWDSTGQEEVYAWTKYFGYEDKADVTLNAILGYDPAIPHWGYNGSARRYWDFIFAAKDRRLERQLHHYGSGLNAIPLLSEFREHPDDFYLLRVGYAGTMGALTDIDQDGFASAAFHSFPDMLKPDPYSGDYGPNFFGHAFNTATYLVHHPEFGWLAFGGNVEEKDGKVIVSPRDSSRQRVYIASLGLWLTLDAGTFDAIEVDPKTGIVRVGLTGSGEFTNEARLRIEQPAKIGGIGIYGPKAPLKLERGAHVAKLDPGITWIELVIIR